MKPTTRQNTTKAAALGPRSSDPLVGLWEDWNNAREQEVEAYNEMDQIEAAALDDCGAAQEQRPPRFNERYEATLRECGYYVAKEKYDSLADKVLDIEKRICTGIPVGLDGLAVQCRMMADYAVDGHPQKHSYDGELARQILTSVESLNRPGEIPAEAEVVARG
jgi:hypothetical protein